MKVQEVISLHEGIVKSITGRYRKWKERKDNLTAQKKWDDMLNKDLFHELAKAEEILSIKNSKRRLESLSAMQREARDVIIDYILPQFRKRGLKKPTIADTVYDFPRTRKKK